MLRGEWLAEGALVCAVGANDPTHRELDNAVLERAAFVCCDSREQSRLESGDLIEPVERGVLDWLEVHELQDVVSGEIAGRASPARTSSSSSRTAWPPGIWRPRRARARARPRARASASSSEALRRRAGAAGRDDVVADRLQDIRALEDSVDLFAREAVVT